MRSQAAQGTTFKLLEKHLTAANPFRPLLSFPSSVHSMTFHNLIDIPIKFHAVETIIWLGALDSLDPLRTGTIFDPRHGGWLITAN